MISKQIRFSIILLVLILSISFFVSLCWTEGYWQGFWQNLGTEIIGIILTIFLIDLILRKQEFKKVKKISKISIKNISNSLDDYIEVLLSFNNDTGKDQYYDLNNAFNKTYYSKISEIDFSLPSQHITKISRYDFLILHKDKYIRNAISNINKYALFLDEDFINIVEETIASSKNLLPSNMFHFGISKKEETKKIFKGGLGNELKIHIDSLLNLINYCNSSDHLDKKIERIQVTSYTDLQVFRN